MASHVLLVLPASDRKVPDDMYGEEQIREEMERRYGIRRVLGRDAFERPRPKTRDSPFALPAEEMYRGRGSAYSKAHSFVEEIRRSHEVDLFFLSPGYHIVGGDELIYYYQCQLGEAGRHEASPANVAPHVLQRLEEETERKDYDTVIVSLPPEFYEVLHGERSLWKVLSENLQNSQTILMGPDTEKAAKKCDELGLRFVEMSSEEDVLFTEEAKDEVRTLLDLEPEGGAASTDEPEGPEARSERIREILKPLRGTDSYRELFHKAFSGDISEDELEARVEGLTD